MTDGRNFFDQSINTMNKTYENIRKIATVKVMTIQLVVFQIIPISKKITK